MHRKCLAKRQKLKTNLFYLIISLAFLSLCCFLIYVGYDMCRQGDVVIGIITIGICIVGIIKMIYKLKEMIR